MFKVLLVLSLLSLMLGAAWSACGSLGEQRFQRITWETLPGDGSPASCLVRIFGDGREVVRLRGDDCPPPAPPDEGSGPESGPEARSL